MTRVEAWQINRLIAKICKEHSQEKTCFQGMTFLLSRMQCSKGYNSYDFKYRNWKQRCSIYTHRELHESVGVNGFAVISILTPEPATSEVSVN